MQEPKQYDVSIIGGGLAGLACSILLAKTGASVILFEKEKYPFHKVCGEYVSMESWNFLCSLGLPLEEMNLPLIHKLNLTAPNSTSLSTSLPLGGFGISRYLLDASLMKIALDAGVTVLDETKVENVQRDQFFNLHFITNGNRDLVTSKVCCAAFGKKSNLDVKWKRIHLTNNSKRLNNFIAVKYHVKISGNENTISLHNFENGYCGISKIENDTYSICYLAKAEDLRKCNNSLQLLQEQLLYKNKHLENIFTRAEVLENFPITISQIDFNKKSLVENGVLMLGDAAGMITPLSGNGMSIALNTGKIAAGLIQQYLDGKLTQAQLEASYVKQWNINFSKRLNTGRIIQSFFGSNMLSNLFISVFKIFPFLAQPLIRMTHGKPF